MYSYGEGPNKQHRTIWDVLPDGGGEPVKVTLPLVDAIERVKRDPNRWCFHFPEHDTDPPKRGHAK